MILSYLSSSTILGGTYTFRPRNSEFNVHFVQQRKYIKQIIKEKRKKKKKRNRKKIACAINYIIYPLPWSCGGPDGNKAGNANSSLLCKSTSFTTS